MTTLIAPDGLEPDAVLPQCLDNHYIGDAVFADMVTRGVDYRDAHVTAARERAFRTEFVRSLVYASQVVVQRASFRNSDFLYRNYLPSDGENLQAFASLVRQGAIVPYLYREHSLDEDLSFETRGDGDRATRALVDEVGDAGLCVRLSVDDAENARLANSMATAFGSGLTRLAHLDSQQRNAMAAELFADASVLHGTGAASWQAFDHALDALARSAFDMAMESRRGSGHVSRSDIYRAHFIDGGGGRDVLDSSVANGRFLKPDSDSPFVLELKKFVDLVYTTNLPDHLQRYTFTPVGLPSRMALQDAPAHGCTAEQVGSVLSDRETLEYVRRSFMARSQAGMTLPLLQNLSVADVVAIRSLPEWEAFALAQTAILRDPLACLDRLPQFQARFDDFQRALSEWYNRTHRRRVTEQRYCSYVSFAVSVGGALVVAGSDLGPAQGAAGVLVSAGAAALPKRVKGCAAKLMVGVYDLGRRRLDRDRSYTVELMQTSEELLREDVEELIHAATAGRGPAMPPAAAVADQGLK